MGLYSTRSTCELFGLSSIKDNVSVKIFKDVFLLIVNMSVKRNCILKRKGDCWSYESMFAMKYMYYCFCWLFKMHWTQNFVLGLPQE